MAIYSILGMLGLMVITWLFSVRPYITRMTASELHTILTAGMTTIAYSVPGLYVLLLKPSFPDIAGHLVAGIFCSSLTIF